MGAPPPRLIQPIPVLIEQIDKQRTDNLDAYNLYLMGRYFWNKRTEEGLKKSVDYFEQALAEDPEYALAHVGLADAYQIMVNYGWLPREDGYPKAKKQALKALEIEPNLAEAYATIGVIAWFLEWDWEEAEIQLKRAIELNPNYSASSQWYSELLHIVGQPKEAREQINRALELDPLSFSDLTMFDDDPSVFFLHTGDSSFGYEDFSDVVVFNDTYLWACLLSVDIDRDGHVDLIQNTVTQPGTSAMGVVRTGLELRPFFDRGAFTRAQATRPERQRESSQAGS